MTNGFDKKLLKKLAVTFRRHQQSIAVAESVTSGLLQFALSNAPDASEFYQGGITAYNIGQKYKHLQVEPIHALSVNCVSQQVAIEMAMEVREKFCSDWGIGITGYATPVPASGKEVYAYFAIVFEQDCLSKGRISPKTTNPQLIQQEYVQYVLRKLPPLLIQRFG